MNEEAVLNVLKTITDQNAEILEKMADIPTRAEFRNMEEKVTRSTAWIEGNGIPGARTRLVQVEDRVKSLPQDVQKDILMNLTKSIGVPAFIGLMTWTAAVIFAASKFLP